MENNNALEIKSREELTANYENLMFDILRNLYDAGITPHDDDYK